MRQAGLLRVQIDEEYLTPAFGKGGAEVEGGRGLAHAALPVDYRDNYAHVGHLICRLHNGHIMNRP